MERGPESQIRTEGYLRTSSIPHRIPQLRLPDAKMAGMPEVNAGALDALRFVLTILVVEREQVDRALRCATFESDLAKGTAEVSGPLKAVLQSISVVYAKYQVCSWNPVLGSSLPIITPGHRCHQGQDRDTLLTPNCAGETFRAAHK